MIRFAILLLFISPYGFGQNSDTIQVFFLYGSRPRHSHWHQESHYFGGFHGGHVSIGIDSSVIGFHHVKGLHLIGHRKPTGGVFECKRIQDFLKDTVNSKYTTFKIPLTKVQHHQLLQIFNDYRAQTPYDYAFFGMRCAAAAYDVLSQIGIFKVKSKCGNIASNFYPKLFRKKMFALALENHYKINQHIGRKSRKWEND
jgi:hypothetical protein